MECIRGKWGQGLRKRERRISRIWGRHSRAVVGATHQSYPWVWFSRSPPCLNFNVRGARGNHPFKQTAHLCGFTCAYWMWRLLFPHLHDNRGLKRLTQSEFWADKCQANISFLFFSRVVGSVDFWAKSWILLWAGSNDNYIRWKSQPITLGSAEGPSWEAKDPESPSMLPGIALCGGGGELIGERNSDT